MTIDIDWLEKIILSRKVTSNEREALSCLSISNYREGDSIIQKNQDGGVLYILRSGVAQVEDNNEGIRVRIAGLQEGTIFGEMSFLNNQKTTAEVIALGDCVVYKLSKDSFSQIMSAQQDLAYTILAQILDAQTSIVQQMNAQLVPIWRNIKKKAQQLPLIVKLVPVIFLVAYTAAFFYVSMREW